MIQIEILHIQIIELYYLTFETEIVKLLKITSRENVRVGLNPAPILSR